MAANLGFVADPDAQKMLENNWEIRFEPVKLTQFLELFIEVECQRQTPFGSLQKSTLVSLTHPGDGTWWDTPRRHG